MTPAAAPAPAKIGAGLATIYVVWGSTYLAIRIMDETVPALLGAGARFALAGVILWLALRWRAARQGRPLTRVTGPQLASCALIGTLLAAGGNGLVTVAEKHVPSSIAALLIASVPLWVILLRSGAGERVTRATLISVGAGFAGLVLLLLPGSRPAGMSAAGAVLLLVAAASWATGSFASTRLPLPSDPLLATSLQMTAGGVLMLVAGLADGEPSHVSHLSVRSSVAFVYLVLIGSIVAYSAYVWLLGNAPLSQVATYAYVNPVVAVFLGWLVLGESVGTTTLLGAAVVVLSVAAVVRRGSGARTADP